MNQRAEHHHPRDRYQDIIPRFMKWEHDPIAYDSFNIHENDPKIKPDVFVSKQHMLRVSPTTLRNLAGQILGWN